jgi:hypothetical protein
LLAVLAWLSLSLGTTAFVCGIALIGWDIKTGRQELAAIGTPIVFAGQIALVLGLILQLDRLWRASRWTAAHLETVGGQLHDLKRSSMQTTSPASSSAFYTHWSGGAGPEILLGDLKSQLDLLAVKLSSESHV